MFQHYSKLKTAIAVIFLIAVLFQGCAPSPVPPARLTGSGVILTPDPENRDLLWWETPDFNWPHYHSILLDPVHLRLEEDEGLDRETLDAVVQEIPAMVAEGLVPDCSLVSREGPGVLRLRVTITDIDPARPALNIATTLAVFVPLDMGGAAIEAEFFDGVSGQRMAAMAEQKTGSPLQLFSGFSRLGHARVAVTQWAEELKTALAGNP